MNQLETEALDAYRIYFDSYVIGDADSIADLLDENYTQVGSAEAEVFFNKKDALQFLKDTIHQVAGKTSLRNRILKTKQLEDYTLVIDLFDIYALTGDEWVFYSRLRATTLMEKTGGKWKFTYQHSSVPDMRTEMGENIAIEKIADENFALKDAIKRRTIELEQKNRELEIESSLERVRTVAMSMQQPADMLDICSVISKELLGLGISNIRNIQTAIFYIANETYLNYEYFTLYDHKVVTKVEYNIQPDVKAFVNKMQQDPEAFFTTSFEGEKLEEWINYQQGAKQYVDQKLYEVNSLHYYFYSIGPGALGISTYTPLNETNIAVFKRFRNVFELAYRRFVDIELAIAQANEAKIEASLERVRARAMSMRTSNDLLDVCEALYAELQKPGFSELRNAMINIHDDEKESFLNYDYSPSAGKTITHHFYNSHPVIEKQVRQIRSSADAFSETVFSGKELEEWKQFRKEKGEPGDPMVDNISALYYYFYSIGNGSIGISTYSSISGEKRDLLKRFRNVFDLAYRRFTDIQQAEAQAREAKIQLALERVRARTMAMQNSSELPEAANLLFQQIQSLGMPAWSAGYCIWDDDKQAITLSMCSEGVLQPMVRMPLTEDPSLMHFREAWERGESFFIEEVGGQALKDHYTYLRTLPGVKETLDDIERAGFPVPTLQIFHLAYFTQGFLLFITYEQVTESHDIFKRFGKVFEQTYTRFLDLQKAELQTRESQIELALERVRARTMAMQKSEELAETAAILFQQFKNLGETPIQITIGIVNENENQIELQVTDWAGGGAIVGRLFNISINEPLVGNKAFMAWKEKKKSIVIDLQGKDLQNWIKYRDAISGVPDSNYQKDGRRVISFGFFSKGAISISTGEPRPAETVRLLERFANVFDGTYTRFLDLQMSEAQAREAQIEAALERVRAKTMAMQKSTDLGETSALLFRQLNTLVPELWTCGFVLCDKNKKDDEWWLSGGSGFMPDLILPNVGDALHNNIYNAWLNGESYYEEIIQGESLQQHYAWLMTIPSARAAFDAQANAGIKQPVWQQLSCAYFSRGYLVVITEKPCGQAQVFKRFAQVFEQTYTRFLDLQKAEAQAREAQIEAALERVRSHTMGMHSSEDLGIVASVMFDQMRILGGDLFAFGIVLCNKHENMVEQWHSIGDKGMLPPFLVPVDLDYIHRYRYDQWEAGVDLFSIEIPEDYIAQHFKLMSDLPSVKIAMDELAAKNIDLPIPAWEIDYGASFRYGYLLVSSYKPFEEEKIFPRFAKVFEQAYTRFLDLQKAEAQAREAQIEAALERVRSRSMGMQKSDELKEVIQVVYEQFVHLKIHIEHTGFIIDYKANDDMHIWLADRLEIPTRVTIPYFDCAHWNSFKEAKQKGIDFFANQLDFEEKNKFYEDLFELVPGVPEEAKKYYFNSPGLAISTVLLENVGLYIENFSAIPYTDEENTTLMRFGKVFQQTYTRFLDLQKAEEQARESRIEAALERVRSRSMGMQKSEELREIIQVIYDQLVQLNFNISNAGFLMDYREHDDGNIWMTDATTNFPTKQHIPNFEHPFNRDYLEQKEKGPELFTKIYPFKEKNSWWEGVFKYLPAVSAETKKTLLGLPALALSRVLMKNIGLYLLNFEGTPYSDQENATLLRFGKVFEQTYTRFNDLQKAEAQARESQIEMSLERIRSASMAMHSSEELLNVIRIFTDQLSELGFYYHTANFITNESMPDWEVWISSPGVNNIPAKIHVPYLDHVLFNERNDSVEEGKEFLTIVLDKEEKNRFFQYLYEKTTAKITPEERKQWIYEQKGMGLTTVLMKNISLSVINYDGILYTKEENDVIKRLAAVFEQSYTRFLDLQKAETQAREAQVEAALEKVRSRSLAMHRSDELQEVVHTVFEKLNELNVELYTAIIFIFVEGSKDIVWWLENKARQQYARILVPFADNHYLKDIFEAKEKGNDFFSTTYSFEEKNELFRHLFENTDFKYVPEQQKQFLLKSDLATMSVALAKNTGINITSYSKPSFSEKENEILKRFGKVFDQAYTRFLDLQKAEAQALEAIKRASVDRVRAEIASMRTTNDLEKITPLIWNELTTLGVPFIRCGVFIMDDDQQIVQTHLSTPDGKAIAGFNLPYYANTQSTQIVNHWNQKKIFKDHMDEAAFIEFTTSLEMQGVVKSGEKYLTENRPTDLYLHFLPFMQGMLYVGNTAPLTDDALQVVQNLADAFSTAYARYEDFNKLELAKKQVDSTLDELQATQKQLIQAEKMASLGELTAGIAHEIQNPLNFVNNFSEVSHEMLDEMKTELATGNMRGATEIADDLQQNLEKILHHGKRADAIVKGMLQHSRSSTGSKEPSDINALADEYLRLAYHGQRAKDKTFNTFLKTDFDVSIGNIEIISHDIGRVLLNLYNNAFYAVSEKSKQHPAPYEPTVSVSTVMNSDKLELKVADNGNGIPKKLLDKIFQPFFTTKPTGDGTGLGLSLSYDIVKAHGGEIKVETKEGEGSTFIIELPIK